MHALEVIGYRHSDLETRDEANKMYKEMVYNLHLNTEDKWAMDIRLSEDRITKGTVVS